MSLKAFLKKREEAEKDRFDVKVEHTKSTSEKLDLFLKKMKTEKTFSLEYKVVGVTFEGRQAILRNFYEENKKTGKLHKCDLILDDENPYDKNAVGVFLYGDKLYHVGFISKDENNFVRENFCYIKDIRVKRYGFMPDNGTIGLTIEVTYEG